MLRHELVEFGRVAVACDLQEFFPSLGRLMDAMSASHSMAADLTRVSSTVRKSNAEPLIALSTSAVAVCCWRASRSSPSRRAFSMAIIAWAPKVGEQLDLFFGERQHFAAVNCEDFDKLIVLKHGHTHGRANATQFDRFDSSRVDALCRLSSSADRYI